MTNRMARVAIIKTVPLTNIETLVLKQSYMTYVSELIRETRQIKDTTLTKVPSSALVKESNIFVDDVLIEIKPQISANTL